MYTFINIITHYTPVRYTGRQMKVNGSVSVCIYKNCSRAIIAVE